MEPNIRKRLDRRIMAFMPPIATQRRWYHLTPDRFVNGLLVVQVLLLLSQRFHWFAFNERKGWTVLIGLAVLGAAVVVLVFWSGVALLLRRGFLFSLRTLLVFVVVCAIVCSWMMNEAKRQRNAVKAIGQLGGEVRYNQARTVPSWLHSILGEDFFDKIESVDLENTQDADSALEHLEGLTGVESLYLHGTQTTDAGLMHLERLTNLRMLDLYGTQVTDTGLVHLRDLTHLSFLDLDHTQISDAGLVHLRHLANLRLLDLSSGWNGAARITDAGLKHLKGMTNLERLILNGTQITDAGLVHLKGLTKIEVLELEKTKISDAGLEHLRGFTNLQSLSLWNTQVTDAGLKHLAGLASLAVVRLGNTQVTDDGVRKLQEALPNCQVID